MILTQDISRAQQQEDSKRILAHFTQRYNPDVIDAFIELISQLNLTDLSPTFNKKITCFKTLLIPLSNKKLKC